MSWREQGEGPTWIPVINKAEIKYGIPKDLLARQLYQECHWRHDIISGSLVSPAGAIGIAQLLPKYFPGCGRDPVRDIDTAAAYLRSLYKRFSQDWQLGLAAYDWGPSDLSRLLKKGGCTFCQLPPETRKYVSEITADVPVEGVLCKIPNQTAPAGAQQAQPSAVPSSAVPSGKSWWQSVTKYFTRASPQNSPAPSPLSASSPSGTSSPTVVENNHLTNHLTNHLKESPMANQSVGQAILAVLESDLLTAAGGPLLAFLQSTKANPSPMNFAAQWVALQGAVVGQLPSFEATVAQQIITVLQTKLQAAITAAQAAAAPSA
jgi:Transglycosylase SLT domain